MAYIGFKKLSAKLGSGLAATIGRKKYGKDKFQNAAAKGKKMKGMAPKALGGEVIEEEPELTKGQTKQAVKSVLKGQGYRRKAARKTARHMTKAGTAKRYLEEVRSMKSGALRGIASPSSMRKDIIEKGFREGRKSGGLVGKLRDGGTSDDDKYGRSNKVVTKTKKDGVKTKEKSYTYKARSGHTAHITTKKMKNRKAEPGEIKKSESFRGEVENRDDVDNPTIHSFESQKYKGGTKWSSKSYKKKTPEINIEDGRAGLPTLKSGGLVGKLRNGGKNKVTVTRSGWKKDQATGLKTKTIDKEYHGTTHTYDDEPITHSSRTVTKRMGKTKHPGDLKKYDVRTWKGESGKDYKWKQIKYKGKPKERYSSLIGKYKKGGLVNRLQNGGLGIQSYDDNLKKGGLAKKARKKY